MDRNLFLALTLGATFQCLAQTPEPMEVRRAEAVFEELPELKASEILKPELLKGPHHVVRDPVPTGSGMNQFTIDSDFGVFEADGNEMLLQRLKEIDAIARLQEVSRTDEFKKSLLAAAKKLGQEHRPGSGAGDFQRSKRNHEIFGARQGNGRERRERRER